MPAHDPAHHLHGQLSTYLNPLEAHSCWAPDFPFKARRTGQSKVAEISKTDGALGPGDPLCQIDPHQHRAMDTRSGWRDRQRCERVDNGGREKVDQRVGLGLQRRRGMPHHTNPAHGLRFAEELWLPSRHECARLLRCHPELGQLRAQSGDPLRGVGRSVHRSRTIRRRHPRLGPRGRRIKAHQRRARLLVGPRDAHQLAWHRRSAIVVHHEAIALLRNANRQGPRQTCAIEEMVPVLATVHHQASSILRFVSAQLRRLAVMIGNFRASRVTGGGVAALTGAKLRAGLHLPVESPIDYLGEWPMLLKSAPFCET